MNYDGIIFDLDGTLWDSTKEIYDTWKLVIEADPRNLNQPTMEQFMGVMGLSNIDLMRRLFPSLTEEEGTELFDRCCAEENAYLRVHGAFEYAGVSTMLRSLAVKYPLAIVSNCNDGYIECYLESMGTAAYITDFESYGRTQKPKSENIKLVVERNRFQNPVYVGDTVWDMEAATAAGVPFIHAAYGFGKVEADVPHIQSPMELISLLEADA